MPIDSSPDHVAVAVPSIERAALRWRDQLGGRWIGPPWPMPDAGFQTRQLRFRGGAKLELLQPIGSDGFASRFLDRYGARIHHVTLKVPALLPAVETLRGYGLHVVDIFAEGDVWHEAFLRPHQTGGLLIQIAWSSRSDEDWARLTGAVPEDPAGDAAILVGPILAHPDLDVARAVWSALGAEVEPDGDTRLRVAWPGAPLVIQVERGEAAGPTALRFADAPHLPADPSRFGPATVTA